MQLYSQQIPFQAGSTYTTTIWMKADKDNVPVDFSWNSGPDSYTHLQGSEKTVIVSQVWQMFTMPTVSAAADGSYRLHLDFSKAGVPAGTTFYVDNIIVDREDAAAVETPPSVRVSLPAAHGQCCCSTTGSFSQHASPKYHCLHFTCLIRLSTAVCESA